jgi:AcrR family transcriptional regulator
VAARVLSEDGAPALEITTVAARAGVTRPVVYRFFPTRTALLVGVLEDFESDLVHRYQQALLRTPNRTPSVQGLAAARSKARASNVAQQ